MENPLYNLNHNQFDKLSQETLRNLFNNTEYSDVVLVSGDGEQMKAHRAIISVRSELLQTMFKSNPHPKPIIFLTGIAFHHLKLLVEFMYKGECMVEEGHLGSFLNIGKTFRVEGIFNQPLYQTQNSDDSLEDSSKLYFEEKYKRPMRHETVVLKDANEIKAYDKTDEPITIASLSDVVVGFTDDIDRDHHTKLDENGLNFQELKTTQVDGSNATENLLDKNECHICNQVFTSPYVVKRHILSRHEGLKYTCDKCQQEFSLKDSLNRHVRRVHEGNKVVCLVCSRVFTHSDHLNMHIKEYHSKLMFNAIF